MMYNLKEYVFFYNLDKMFSDRQLNSLYILKEVVYMFRLIIFNGRVINN